MIWQVSGVPRWFETYHQSKLHKAGDGVWQPRRPVCALAGHDGCAEQDAPGNLDGHGSQGQRADKSGIVRLDDLWCVLAHGEGRRA